MIKHHNFKHGYRTGPYQSIYCSWKGMKARCDNPKATDYKSYGGRGITYQESWKGFLEFFRDMGERPLNTSLDRIDVNKGYFKDNCRWANSTTQANNTNCNVNFEYNNQTKCIAEWARLYGFREDTLRKRLMKHGWSIEKALLTPLRGVIRD